jgi:hypothetical protein
LRTLKILKARITFYIGVIVALLNTVQLIVSFDAIRIVGIAIGLFFVFWGLKVGWTQNRDLSVIGYIPPILSIRLNSHMIKMW